MKPFQLSVVAILLWSQSFAQTNTFPSSGNVGIGTMSPASLLDVNGGSIFRGNITLNFGTTNRTTRLTDNGLYMSRLSDGGYVSSITANGSIEYSTRDHHKFYSNGQQIFTILDGGKVGIGTTNPMHKLVVEESVAGQVNLQIKNGSTANAQAGLVLSNSTNNGTLTKNSIGYSAYKTFAANDFSIYNSTTGGNISILNDYSSGNINFTAGGASTAQMTLLPSGNVGIGTTSPGAPLEVYKSNSGALGGQIVLNNLGIAAGDQTAISFASGGVANSRAQIQSTVEGAPYYGTLEFITGMKGTPASWTEKMRITGAGNVGIGTTSPSQKLDVNGNIKATGFILSTSAGAGKVLTSDASGNATWQTAASSGWSFDGNTVGVLKKIGTTDNYALPFITNNVERMRIGTNGNIGIGTVNINDANYKLFVETGIRTRKVKVDQTTWADYVFHPTYELPLLTEVEAYIKKHQHLPDIPSANEVEKNGLDLGDNQAALLRKIEELTLYVIELQKQVNAQDTKIKALQKRK